VTVLFWAIYAALSIFILVMWVRLILDFVVSFNRGWRPSGVGLVFAEVVFTITDPPIKLVRRVIPPVRFGGVALDFAWTIVMLVAIVLSYIASGLLR
jgi:YggT family protein